ncbi:alpha-glucosidase [Stachybotrys elegans]|uniref:Probable alpha/beta-glucosidase agdC n=1 Tax=Stachybotrys elegans TaxID=80388 RepID=A0A8K0SSM5_9HYPO|nr:alpha-glucosidase [Stachybotrys elegans]
MRHWKSSALALAAAVSAIPNYAALDECPGYVASDVTTSDTGLTARLSLAGDACNVYGDDLQDLILEVTYETANRLHVKIQDEGNEVYQVAESVFPRPSDTIPSEESNLRFDYTEDPFSFTVSRADTDEVLFDTSGTALVFESQYVRLRTNLPLDPNLYGLGEHSDPFRLRTNNYLRTLWNQDSYGIPTDANLYGAQPVYIEHRATGSHGVFLLNSNGMDVIINRTSSGDQFLEYNTLGGVLDFWFMAGPSPVEVTQQYSEVAGLPVFPPYWGLGFHQCRYGYRDTFDTAEAIYNYSRADIPVETFWNDIDYMDRRRVFTNDPDRFPMEQMRQVVDYLHEHDQHYIVMVDPAVAYTDYPPANRGMESDIFLKRSNGSEWLGVVWAGVSVFPDWFSGGITEYWNNEFALFFNAEDGVDIDGLWIDMNEPSNFPCFFPCDDPWSAAVGYPPTPRPIRTPPRQLPGWPCEFQPPGTDCDASAKRSESEKRTPTISVEEQRAAVLPKRQDSGEWKGLEDRDLLYPEYAIRNRAAYRTEWNAAQGGLSNKTVNTNIGNADGTFQYDTHNMYGTMMSRASYDALLARRPGLRPLIISRSSFPSSQKYSGHWLGDNLSNWDHYRKSIRTMLAFTSIYQNAMTGSDTCGFGGDTTEQLCARWAALGAFNPFYRNHNSYNSRSQEFYRWESVAQSARNAIRIRYRLLDYLYTAMYKASTDGTPPLYPMMYLYTDDRATWSLDLQFFYGPGLLVAPVTQQDSTTVDVYLPNDVFYDWYTHQPICGTGATRRYTGQNTTMIPLLIRSGVIMPLREQSAYTTTELRTRDFELLIPLRADGTARGELYLDDGESFDTAFSLITFDYSNGELVIEGEFGYEIDPRITTITVLRSSCASSDVDGNSERRISVDISLNEASTTRFD